ncbi:SigE family RNA polymerase sigma factor [Kitasatospora sp. MBT66]|uniref:SigE family RNA polymerase sigma factor n=1 Tax=Kitasatospora sp. MBT66 TaxID=1444769 RepID=UPI001E3ACE7B|nr:SigE family RNA polymerase sigma factor [Kitasatospora sp. MBT66]
MSMAIGRSAQAAQERRFGLRRLLALLFGARETQGAGELLDVPVAAQTAGQRRAGFRLLAGGGRTREAGPTLTELYLTHRLSLVRLAVLLVDHQDQAEDVVQEAFAKLYQRHGDELDDLDNALAYLRTAVVNGARSVLRRRRTAREYVPPHEADAPSAEDHAVLHDEHRRVLVAMQELTARQREVLVLRYWSDLSESEIAEILAVSRGTVKSTASRALDALERKLGDAR